MYGDKCGDYNDLRGERFKLSLSSNALHHRASGRRAWRWAHVWMTVKKQINKEEDGGYPPIGRAFGASVRKSCAAAPETRLFPPKKNKIWEKLFSFLLELVADIFTNVKHINAYFVKI